MWCGPSSTPAFVSLVINTPWWVFLDLIMVDFFINNSLDFVHANYALHSLSQVYFLEICTELSFSFIIFTIDYYEKMKIVTVKIPWLSEILCLYLMHNDKNRMWISRTKYEIEILSFFFFIDRKQSNITFHIRLKVQPQIPPLPRHFLWEFGFPIFPFHSLFKV